MNACRSCNIVITETDIVSFSAFIQTDNELRYMVDGHIDGVPHVSTRFVSRFVHLEGKEDKIYLRSCRTVTIS